MKPRSTIATEQFLLAHSARLRAYVHVLLGNGHDVEDVLQNVFVKYLRSGPAPSEHAERWLFTVCRNEAVDFRRGGRHRQERERSFAEGAISPGSDPALDAGRQDDVDRMSSCLARLPEEQREMVYLKFAENLSLSQIAESTGVARSTVALRIQEGLALLNRHFHGDARAS